MRKKNSETLVFTERIKLIIACIRNEVVISQEDLMDKLQVTPQVLRQLLRSYHMKTSLMIGVYIASVPTGNHTTKRVKVHYLGDLDHHKLMLIGAKYSNFHSQ